MTRNIMPFAIVPYHRCDVNPNNSYMVRVTIYSCIHQPVPHTVHDGEYME